MSGKERVIQVFGALYELMRQFPIWAGIDPDTVELLARKVPQERLFSFYRKNMGAVLLMQQYGIRFRYDAATVSLAFQALCQTISTQFRQLFRNGRFQTRPETRKAVRSLL